MMERTTVREIREALAAAQAGGHEPTESALADELEALSSVLEREIRTMQGEASPAEVPTARPDQSPTPPASALP